MRQFGTRPAQAVQLISKSPSVAFCQLYCEWERVDKYKTKQTYGQIAKQHSLYLSRVVKRQRMVSLCAVLYHIFCEYCRTHNVRVCLYIAYIIACGSASLFIKTLYFFLTVLALSAAATVANIKIRYDAKTPQFAIFGTRVICVFYSSQLVPDIERRRKTFFYTWSILGIIPLTLFYILPSTMWCQYPDIKWLSVVGACWSVIFPKPTLLSWRDEECRKIHPCSLLAQLLTAPVTYGNCVIAARWWISKLSKSISNVKCKWAELKGNDSVRTFFWCIVMWYAPVSSYR